MTIRLPLSALLALFVFICSACVLVPDYEGPPVAAEYPGYSYGSYAYPWEFGERVDIVNGYGHGGYGHGGWRGGSHGGAAFHGGGGHGGSHGGGRR